MVTETNIPAQMITDQSANLKACYRKVERLSNCIEIANLINSELSIGKLLTNVMETTKKAFTSDAVSMLLIDEATGDLTFQIALGDVGDEIKEIYRLKKGQGIAGLVAETGEPLNIKDAHDHPSFSPDYDKKTNYRTRAMLCVPLKIRGEVIGVIQVINKLVEPFVFTQDEMEMLITIASSAAVAVDTAKMHKLILQQKTLERDLRLAKEVQDSFLPKDLPDIPGFKFAALNQPALEIGGDFYNFFKLPSGKLGILLGDVSGKGISASLFMARLSSDFQYYTLLYPEPCQLLTQINNVLCERAKRGMFVTLVYMLLDINQKTVQVANGGHMSPIVCDEDGVQLLNTESSKGPPLGIMSDIEYSQKTFQIDDHTNITIYTDGVIEAKNSDGELYGTRRLMDVIEKQPNDPDQIVNEITHSVDGFAMAEGRGDDLTLMVFSTD